MTSDAPTDLPTWLLAQEDLAAAMVQDLRNPLAAIQANLSFLDLSVAAGDQESREAIADIRLATDMLLRLIENQAAMARLESPRAPQLARVATSLPAAVRAAVERARAVARSAGVEVTLQLPADDLQVLADRSLLELLVDNLLGNAVQHVRRDHGATLSVQARGDRAVLELEDEGGPFGSAGVDFTRLGQLEIKKQPDSRYSRGLALYVVGLVARACDAAITTGARDGRSVVTLSFPRVGP